MMTTKVLLVDDDANVLSAYKRELCRRFHVHTEPGGREALRTLKRRGPFAVVVSDLRMPVMDGIRFLHEAMKRAPDTVRMMLTGNADL